MSVSTNAKKRKQEEVESHHAKSEPREKHAIGSPCAIKERKRNKVDMTKIETFQEIKDLFLNILKRSRIAEKTKANNQKAEQEFKRCELQWNQIKPYATMGVQTLVEPKVSLSSSSFYASSSSSSSSGGASASSNGLASGGCKGRNNNLKNNSISMNLKNIDDDDNDENNGSLSLRPSSSSSSAVASLEKRKEEKEGIRKEEEEEKGDIFDEFLHKMTNEIKKAKSIASELEERMQRSIYQYQKTFIEKRQLNLLTRLILTSDKDDLKCCLCFIHLFKKDYQVLKCDHFFCSDCYYKCSFRDCNESEKQKHKSEKIKHCPLCNDPIESSVTELNARSARVAERIGDQAPAYSMFENPLDYNQLNNIHRFMNQERFTHSNMAFDLDFYDE